MKAGQLAALGSVKSASRFTAPINLQAANGQYVTAEEGGGGIVNANRDQAYGWETFTIHDLDHAVLTSGDRVTFRSYLGPYLQAEGGGRPTARLLAAGAGEGPWETFKIIKEGGGVINSGDHVFIQSTSDPPFYVVAELGGGSVVNVNSDAAGVYETFTIVIQ